MVVYTADMYDILNGCCFAVSVHVVVVVVVQCSYSINSEHIFPVLKLENEAVFKNKFAVCR